jgi:hypothetical protein
MPINYDFDDEPLELEDAVLIIGDTYRPFVSVSFQDENGTTEPLDGVTGEFVIAMDPGEDVLATGTVTVDEATDSFYWEVSAEDTAAIPTSYAGQHARAALRLTFADGTVRTYFEYPIEIRRTVLS